MCMYDDCIANSERLGIVEKHPSIEESAVYIRIRTYMYHNNNNNNNNYYNIMHECYNMSMCVCSHTYTHVCAREHTCNMHTYTQSHAYTHTHTHPPTHTHTHTDTQQHTHTHNNTYTRTSLCPWHLESSQPESNKTASLQVYTSD